MVENYRKCSRKTGGSVVGKLEEVWQENWKKWGRGFRGVVKIGENVVEDFCAVVEDFCTVVGEMAGIRNQETPNGDRSFQDLSSVFFPLRT